jgi:hypothetical protein
MTLDDQTRIELIQLVKTAVSEAVEQHPLSPEEVHWVRMAIKAEANRAEFRKAVIEKTLAGLAIAALVAIAGIFMSGFKGYLGK